MSSYNKLDGVALIIDNCRFISSPNVDFTVVMTRDQRPIAACPWTAHVLRTVDGFRTLFLYARGQSPEIAISELLAKSADAVRSYIVTNGYALPPSSDGGPSKAPNDERNHPSLSDSSLTIDVFEKDFSMSSGCESLSDDETVSVASGAKAKKTKHKKGKEHKHKEGGKPPDTRLSRSRSRSRSTTRSASRSRSRSRSRARSCSSAASSGIIGFDPSAPDTVRPWGQPQVPIGPGFTPFRGAMGNPPPPPGYTSWPPHMPGMPVRCTRGPPPHVSSPSPVGPPGPPPPTPLNDVLIRIHWLGRGRAQVMKRLAPTKSSLRSAAVAYVRRNPDAFPACKPSDSHALKMQTSAAGPYLTATLRSVVVGGSGEQVDLRHYQGDSLAALIQQDAGSGLHTTSGGLLKFEIDVVVSLPPPPPPSHLRGMGMRPSRPVSGGQVVGDC